MRVGLAVLLLHFGLLVPIAQILRWSHSRPEPTRVEAVVAAIARRLRLDDDLRRFLRLAGAVLVPFVLVAVLTRTDDGPLPLVATAPVILLNLAGLLAERARGRGRR